MNILRCAAFKVAPCEAVPWPAGVIAGKRIAPMTLLTHVLGRPLADHEDKSEKIGPALGVPVIGLDALASAAYGPEAALTILLPLGAAGIVYSVPVTGVILALLTVLYLSYRQTIAAYPNGGGSYTVAKENLGLHAGLLARHRLPSTMC